MKYLEGKFSVAMPGGDKWPFDPPRLRRAWLPGDPLCPACGSKALPGIPHDDPSTAGRPVRRICFGRTV